ncbi:MAG: SlyX family protein [Gammaproteobacteria bacterium]|nr:SlyX family protein [Gammaproteobacteria bacterium]
MNNIPAKHWPSAIGLTYAEGLFTAYYRYMTDDETQARLTALEARIEFQEETIRQLNDALVVQQQRYFTIDRTLALLVKRLQGEAFDSADLKNEPPPPHY